MFQRLALDTDRPQLRTRDRSELLRKERREFLLTMHGLPPIVGGKQSHGNDRVRHPTVCAE
jgi:hypothetical protein